MEFLQDNQPVTAWVLDVQGPRLRVFTSGQRELKLPLSRALPWLGPQCPVGSSRQDMLDLLRTHNGRRERLAESVDALEIWDLAQGEVDEAEIEWFASLIFEDASPDQLAAVGRKLLQTKTHFKFSPPQFEIYPQETVERRQEELRKAQERERLVGFGQVFLKGLWDIFCKRKSALPQPDEEQSSRIRDLLMTRLCNPDDRDSDALWKTMCQGLPEDPHLPLFLAQAWGIVPPHFNFHLCRAQYYWEPDWAVTHTEAVTDLQQRVLATRTEPEIGIVTIDSASTQDIDDGFDLTRDEDGFTLHLALACPCLGWEFGSPLDKAVLHRFTSLYLPEGTSHMLPETLGKDFFSLCAGQERPALVITFDLGPDGATRSFKPRITWIRITANLTYTGVENEIAKREPCMLHHARDLATLLRQARIRDHAVIMDQPDPRMVLRGEPSQPGSGGRAVRVHPRSAEDRVRIHDPGQQGHGLMGAGDRNRPALQDPEHHPVSRKRRSLDRPHGHLPHHQQHGPLHSRMRTPAPRHHRRQGLCPGDLAASALFGLHQHGPDPRPADWPGTIAEPERTGEPASAPLQPGRAGRTGAAHAPQILEVRILPAESQKDALVRGHRRTRLAPGDHRPS
jgi:exoribonuclease II